MSSGQAIIAGHNNICLYNNKNDIVSRVRARVCKLGKRIFLLYYDPIVHAVVVITVVECTLGPTSTTSYTFATLARILDRPKWFLYYYTTPMVCYIIMQNVKICIMYNTQKQWTRTYAYRVFKKRAILIMIKDVYYYYVRGTAWIRPCYDLCCRSDGLFFSC